MYRFDELPYTVNFRYNNRLSRSKTQPANNDTPIHTVVNMGYLYAERGSNSLPYDYPCTQANGTQASSATTFQPRGSKRSTNYNSISTCGYIEMSPQANSSNSRPHPVTYVAPTSPRIITNQLPLVTPSSSANTNTNRSQNNTRVVSTPADSIYI